MNDIHHIRPPKAKAALITLVPDSFQVFKMIFDAAVIKSGKIELRSASAIF
jgi:hypothetical protein